MQVVSFGPYDSGKSTKLMIQEDSVICLNQQIDKQIKQDSNNFYITNFVQPNKVCPRLLKQEYFEEKKIKFG